MKKYSINDIVVPLMDSATDKELLELVHNAIDRMQNRTTIKKLKKDIDSIHELEFSKVD